MSNTTCFIIFVSFVLAKASVIRFRLQSAATVCVLICVSFVIDFELERVERKFLCKRKGRSAYSEAQHSMVALAVEVCTKYEAIRCSRCYPKTQTLSHTYNTTERIAGFEARGCEIQNSLFIVAISVELNSRNFENLFNIITSEPEEPLRSN